MSKEEQWVLAPPIKTPFRSQWSVEGGYTKKQAATEMRNLQRRCQQMPTGEDDGSTGQTSLALIVIEPGLEINFPIVLEMVAGFACQNALAVTGMGHGRSTRVNETTRCLIRNVVTTPLCVAASHYMVCVGALMTFISSLKLWRGEFLLTKLKGGFKQPTIISKR